MNYVFLLLGSNLGDRQMQLLTAIAAISERVGAVLKKSAVYETQSWGRTNEPDYLNQVIALETDLAAHVILNKILAIEADMGRIRHEKWGSRLIDIDILFFNNEIIEQDGLQIPHPELHNRKFTLSPLAEIAPDLVHPVLNKTMLDLKNGLKDSLIVKKL